MDFIHRDQQHVRVYMIMKSSVIAMSYDAGPYALSSQVTTQNGVNNIASTGRSW